MVQNYFHFRYFPYGPDTYVMMFSCVGHFLKEGFNIADMWDGSRNWDLGRQAAATFQVFVYICAVFNCLHCLLCLLLMSDYDPPYPWQLVVINAVFFPLLLVLFVKIYLDEFVLGKVE